MSCILIKGGRIWNGNEFFNADVLTQDQQIISIAENICQKADFVYDAKGMIVSCGLVDIHAHMLGVSSHNFGIQAEMSCFPFGVTAACDAGAIHGNKQLLDTFSVKNKVFIGAQIKENRFNVDHCQAALERYDNRTAGIKIYFSAGKNNIWDVSPLQAVCDFAREKGIKVMVHCSGSPKPMEDIVCALSKGDILTHIYHGGNNNCTDNDFSALRLAREKGIVLDAGFAGHVHTDLAIFQKAVSSGFLPDTISTDITCASAYKRGGRYGMTTCMSMARTAGMAEADIFRAVTATPAKALEMSEQWGCLKEGGTADIAVISYENEGFDLTDRAGNKLASDKGYRCKLCVSNGNGVYKD